MASKLIQLVKNKFKSDTSFFYDFILFRLGIYSAASFKTQQPIVAYVGTHLPGRISRIAKWVKKSSNYFTLVICKRDGYNEQMASPVFDHVLLYRNYWHALRIVKGISNVSLVHGFSPKSKDIYYLKKHLNIPVLLDVQDVLLSYFEQAPKYKWQREELHYEKLCFHFVDGIVAHSLEPISAFKRAKVKEKPPTLFFPIFCDNDSFIVQPQRISEEEIHVVYAGGVASIKSDTAETGNIVFHNLIQKFSNQKIHFHIYPSPVTDRGIYKEYKDIEKANPYFHFHDPVAQDDLSEELSQYHFGILPFFREDNSVFSDDKFIYATSLKVFNYMEAGVPVLLAKDLTYLSWLLERYACGVAIDYSDLEHLTPFITVKTNKQYSADLMKGRETLSLKNNIHKLLTFYEQISH